MDPLLVQIIAILIVNLLIFQNSFHFNPLRFTCQNYLLNAYLYILLSLLLIMVCIIVNERYDLLPVNWKLYMVSALVSFGLLILLLHLNPKNIVSKHFVWLLLLVSFAYTMYPLYQNNKQLFYRTGVKTIAIVVIFSLVAFMFPSMIRDSWRSYLGLALVAALVAMVMEYLLTLTKTIDPNNSTYQGYKKYFSYALIILFIFFILSDTKHIIQQSNNCRNPDYINNSLNIVLDAMNIFSNMYQNSM